MGAGKNILRGKTITCAGGIAFSNTTVKAVVFAIVANFDKTTNENRGAVDVFSNLTCLSCKEIAYLLVVRGNKRLVFF